jgi:hypothetical protein
MDIEQKELLLNEWENRLIQWEKQLNDLENEIKKRESGLFHYYKDFIDSLNSNLGHLCH